MNIEQYRALKAQEKQQVAQPTEQPQAADAKDETQTTSTQTSPKEGTPTQTTQEKSTEEQPSTENQTTSPEKTKSEETKEPEKITIEGIGEVTLDELKNGYLRQSDYTKKTQEVSRKNKELEEAEKLYSHLKQNPHLAQQLLQTKKVPQQFDPQTNKVSELEEKVYDMMLQQEISNLQSKYDDFEVREVLEMAQEKKITNLEDAYHLVKSRKGDDKKVDKDAIKQEVLKELQQEQQQQNNKEEKQSTESVITSNDTGPVVQDNSPKLSAAERRIARNMKMSEEEYAKWRDAGRKKD